MKFIIKQDIFERFPELKIGVVVGRGLTIGKRTRDQETLIQSNIKELIEKTGNKTLTDFANIRAWRDTYRQFGVNPKKHKPTAEAFLRRIVKGHAFPGINTAVDAYLAAELVTMLPIGGYDLAAIRGDIRLRVSEGNESFRPIGGSEDETTTAGEIVYSDDQIVLTRNWNYRDSDYTKITEGSKDIVLACEAALPEIAEQDLTLTLRKIVEYETQFCAGEYETHLLDRNHAEVDIRYP
jgi:DNA/RNA-binding domain of Phe-tRNA-synthetase-like protein